MFTTGSSITDGPNESEGGCCNNVCVKCNTNKTVSSLIMCDLIHKPSANLHSGSSWMSGALNLRLAMLLLIGDNFHVLLIIKIAYLASFF